MEHDTNTAPNAPAPRGPGGANLEAYGDWVTVDAGRAASPEPRPRDSAADVDIAHRAPDTRSAQDLTVAEEELLDRLGETESAAAVATPVAGGATPGADTYATNAALAKLERQLSSLSADLKAVGQQLAELRSRGGGAPAVAPEATGEPPPPPPRHRHRRRRSPPMPGTALSPSPSRSWTATRWRPKKTPSLVLRRVPATRTRR